MTLEESSTYQLLTQKAEQKGMQKGLQQGLEAGQLQGRLEESHEVLLTLGALRFGPADDTTANLICQIEDLPRLKRMQKALFTASTWQQMLDIV